jgi:predicted phage terminase large subunit-like protein
VKTLPPRSAVKAELARRSLSEFIKQGWQVVEPETPLRWNWHIDAVSEHLEAVSKHQIQRLLINIPPGTMKSLIVSVFWPAWYWIDKPGTRGLFSSYAQDLALRDSVRCRSLITSDWYRSFFADKGDWGLSGDQNVKSYFSNTRGGFRMALSVGGATTGFRGDLIVCDDPLNATDAYSEVQRATAIQWWDQAMSSRLNDLRTGARVIVQQRLHEDDLAGHVLRQGGYEHLCLPSEYEPERKSKTCIYVRNENYEVVEKKHFWEDPRTQPGELLFKTMFPREVLDRAKKDMGSDMYAGQHQQRPTAAEGGLFKRHWWKFWRHSYGPPPPRPLGCTTEIATLLPHKFDQVVMSVDAAFKGRKDAVEKPDYVAIGVWGVLGADRFLLDVVWDQLTFTETLQKIRTMRKRHPTCRKVLVEDKANGPAIIDTLKGEMTGVIALTPEGGKEARAQAVTPQVESGNVYLPDGAEWVPRYVDELASFPKGRHDDMVDQTSQVLLYLEDSKTSFGQRFLKGVRSGLIKVR